jgi:hypothetical protein
MTKIDIETVKRLLNCNRMVGIEGKGNARFLADSAQELAESYIELHGECERLRDALEFISYNITLAPDDCNMARLMQDLAKQALNINHKDSK